MIDAYLSDESQTLVLSRDKPNYSFEGELENRTILESSNWLLFMKSDHEDYRHDQK